MYSHVITEETVPVLLMVGHCNWLKLNHGFIVGEWLECQTLNQRVVEWIPAKAWCGICEQDTIKSTAQGNQVELLAAPLNSAKKQQ
jgi:hypothetical protein